MKTAQRQNPQRFIPSNGRIYENAGGGRYSCEHSLHYLTGSCDAWMKNRASGWTCLAHGIVRYEDGTIEWDYSTDGHFERIREPEEVIEIRQRQRSMLNALLCCAI